MGKVNREVKYNPAGSVRSGIILPMLNPKNFKIDERSIADFLVFVEKLSSYVFTHPADQNSNGDGNNPDNWKSFFCGDISIFLAKVSTIDLNELLPFYLKEDPIISFENQQKALKKRLDLITDFVSFITNSYHAILNQHGNDPQVKQLIDYLEQIISDGKIDEIIHKNSLIGLPTKYSDKEFKKFESLWANTNDSVLDVSQKNEIDIHELNSLMNRFLAIMSQVVHYSKSLFLETINNNQYHTPGTALFIAFLKLYTNVQDDLNNITAKHLDYFYKEILNQKINPSKPDYVHVCFALADFADRCEIEKGTLFNAGTDEEGYDCLYEAEDYLTINKTKITDLCSIYIPQRDAVGIEDSFEFVSNIYQSKILNTKTGGFDFSLDPKSFSLIEQNKYDTDIHIMTISEIGFAIASPVLLLNEGKRECDLMINFNLKSLSTLLTFLERYTVNKNMTYENAFHLLFFRAYTISLTTTNGWYAVEDYKLHSPDFVNGSFKISFSLPMGSPAITGMGNEWDKKEKQLYETSWPVLKLCLTNQKSMFVYSYLRDLIITSCRIDVDVSGIKNLELFNDLGKVDISNPFYPFGTLPVVGSSFLIGNNELYKKHIDTFNFDLEWHNLPRNGGGFKSYYQEYDDTIDNDSFKVGVTALSDFQFHPTTKDKVQQFSLFATKEENEGQLPVLASVNNLEGFNINELKINPDYSINELQPYSIKAKSGYIKLELTSPEMAFGQSIYPTIFSSKILKGIKNAKIDLPNPPYIPQLKSITLNYHASSIINFQPDAFVKSDVKAKEKMYLLHPFGTQVIFKDSTPFSNQILPQYFHNAYLFIGLDHVILNEPLTLHFILDPSVGNEFEVELPLVEWFYISNDKWTLFDKKDLISDTTKGFTDTGIVKLMMPKFMDNQNTTLPSDKYWISIAFKGDLNLVAKLKGIYTQALKLVWAPNKPGATWAKVIPSGKIERFMKTRTEVASIIQPSPSFGGRDQETSIDFYTRVSERLQHRNRCITAWDFERLILNKFSFVHQVKCISPIDNQGFVDAGNVIIVVVPKSEVEGGFTPPRFNYSVLQEIKECVQRHSSPFIYVQVINPVYEEVKITASIRLSDSGQKGIGVENLNRDLIGFVNPWYFNSNSEMLFGGSINLDEL